MDMISGDQGHWYFECLPDDGGRLSCLRYQGTDLLTSSKEGIPAAGKQFGEYEARPVYGYDDCFPTVDPCLYPGGAVGLRDHGELCWNKWNCYTEGSSLVCRTTCDSPGADFTRRLTFEQGRLLWNFRVTNRSPGRIVFLHVMHALLNPLLIRRISFPLYSSLFDEGRSRELPLQDSATLSSLLVDMKPADFTMLLLRGLSEGRVALDLAIGKTLTIHFDHSLFPTLGIWWNNKAYPGGGLLRSECAFEPIPGSCSKLSDSFSDGLYLSAQPQETISWEVAWELKG